MTVFASLSKKTDERHRNNFYTIYRAKRSYWGSIFHVVKSFF